MNQVIGNPTAFRYGRRTMLVSYVSVGEWHTFGDLLELDEARAVMELVYFSLRRACPTTTRRRVCWWARWHKRALVSLLEHIMAISLPKLPEGTEAPTEPTRDAERDMKTAYRVLSKMHGWTPAEISDMSSAQIHVYSTGGEDGTGIQKMTSAQYQSFRARRGLN